MHAAWEIRTSVCLMSKGHRCSMLVIYNRAEGNKVRVNRDARIVSAQFILEKCKGRDCAEVERRINVVSLTGRLASLLVLESSQREAQRNASLLCGEGKERMAGDVRRSGCACVWISHVDHPAQLQPKLMSLAFSVF